MRDDDYDDDTSVVVNARAVVSFPASAIQREKWARIIIIFFIV